VPDCIPDISDEGGRVPGDATQYSHMIKSGAIQGASRARNGLGTSLLCGKGIV
jgi:hypothetical protein